MVNHVTLTYQWTLQSTVYALVINSFALGIFSKVLK